MIKGIVEYRPTLGRPPEQGDLYVSNIRLTEGFNEVDIEKWQEFTKNCKPIQDRIAQGIIRETFATPPIITSTTSTKKKKEEVREDIPEVTSLSSNLPSSSVATPVSSFNTGDKDKKKDEDPLPLPVVAEKAKR